MIAPGARLIDLGNPASACPDNGGLRAWWLGLANNTGGPQLFDASGRNLPAPLVSGPKWVPGPRGFFGLEFDGSGQRAGATPSAVITQPFSVSCWVRGAAAAGFAKLMGSSSDYGFSVTDNGTGEVNPTMSTTGFVLKSIVVPGVLDSTWHYLHCIYTGAAFRGYRDGVFAASTAASGTVGSGGGFDFESLYIGARPNGSSPWTGQIVDVRLSYGDGGPWLADTAGGSSAADGYAARLYQQALQGHPATLNRYSSAVPILGGVPTGQPPDTATAWLLTA